MSRITKKALNLYPLLVRLIFWAQQLKYGVTLEPSWIWGRSSKLLYGLQVFYRCLDRKQSPVSSKLRALISNRVSQMNNCAFCTDISASKLLRSGVPHENLVTLENYESNPIFSEKERVALAYAETMTDSNQRVDDLLFQRLRKSYSEDEIVELTAWIAFQNLSSKFNAALEIPAQGFCQTPK
ncbi:MAG: carboxymuconolactone decarboxylase family protein [Nitrosomonas sp.]|nr:carboxymuconolactone decarboxylase family protein [Nitrosomonas sp.]